MRVKPVIETPGGPRCGECGCVLPVEGELSRICVLCHPHYEYAGLLDERELKALKEAMGKKGMSAKAVIRHFFRLGQTADCFISEGYEMEFINYETHDRQFGFGNGYGAIFGYQPEDEYCKRGCGQFSHHPPTGECPNESQSQDDSRPDGEAAHREIPDLQAPATRHRA